MNFETATSQNKAKHQIHITVYCDILTNLILTTEKVPDDEQIQLSESRKFVSWDIQITRMNIAKSEVYA